MTTSGKPGIYDFSRDGSGRSYIFRSWQPQTGLCPRPSLCLRGLGLGTQQFLQPGGGRWSAAFTPRRVIPTPFRTGFCRPPAAFREPRQASRRPPRSGMEAAVCVRAAPRTRAGEVAGSLLPRLGQAGTLARPPRPEPPGAARARTRDGRAGPVCSARVLGLAAGKEHSWLSPPRCARSRSSPAACFPPQ